MLLTITMTRTGTGTGTGGVPGHPATDLGFLLHKHPDRVQTFDQAYGRAHVFYPEATDQRCTAALMLEVDPARLVKARRGGVSDFALGQYVNDRPYAASSLFAVALASVFRTALRGRCAALPELARVAVPLRMRVLALPCRGGPAFARELFEPLGWRVEATSVPLDPQFPEWGESRYVRLALDGQVRLSDALNQLYVLLPVLDDAKHYWVSPDEVDKLLRAGTGWLAAHPARGVITRRYLANRRSLTRTAFARLMEADHGTPDADSGGADADGADAAGTDSGGADADGADGDGMGARGAGPGEASPGEAAESQTDTASPVPVPALAERRIQAVLEVLRTESATRVIDLGCGSGKLLVRLRDDAFFARVAGADVSPRAVTQALRRLGLDRLPGSRTDRLAVFQGALTYADARFRGYDAAVLMEVIEHVDPPRLAAVERVVFHESRPPVVVVTTPNAEHNVRYEKLPAGRHRHPDHRFEWTRAEFRRWAEAAATTYDYQVGFRPVGADDPEVGPPTQLAVFTRGRAPRSVPVPGVAESDVPTMGER